MRSLRFASASLALTIGLGGSVAGHAGGATSRWLVSDLGVDGGRGLSRAVALNERGQVIGTMDAKLPRENPSYHAFLWANNRVRDLGTLPLGGRLDMPNSSQALAINDRGDVVGTSQVEATGPEAHAFFWAKGAMRDVGCGRVLPRKCSVGSFAAGINARGQVAVSVGDIPETVGERPLRAAVWRNGRLQLIGTLPGRTSSRSVALNRRGHVVGTSYVLRGDFYWLRLRAFLWRDGRLRDLGTLPGDKESEAVGINDRDQVIGISYVRRSDSGADVLSGFVWQNGRMRSLGRDVQPIAINNKGQIIATRPGTTLLWHDGKTTSLSFTPAAIDDLGDIVGSRTTPSGQSTAVFWQNGVPVDLPSLPGGRLSGAVALNEHGQVVGWSGTKFGSRHAVIWERH